MYYDRIADNICLYPLIAVFHPRLAYAGLARELELIYRDLNPAKVEFDRRGFTDYLAGQGFRYESEVSKDLFREGNERAHCRMKVKRDEVFSEARRVIKIVNSVKSGGCPVWLDCCADGSDVDLSEILESDPGDGISVVCEGCRKSYEYRIPDPREPSALWSDGNNQVPDKVGGELLPRRQLDSIEESDRERLSDCYIGLTLKNISAMRSLAVLHPRLVYWGIGRELEIIYRETAPDIKRRVSEICSRRFITHGRGISKSKAKTQAAREGIEGIANGRWGPAGLRRWLKELWDREGKAAHSREDIAISEAVETAKRACDFIINLRDLWETPVCSRGHEIRVYFRRTMDSQPRMQVTECCSKCEEEVTVGKVPNPLEVRTEPAKNNTVSLEKLREVYQTVRSSLIERT